MSKKVKQIRYYYNNADKNYPKGTGEPTNRNLISGSIFANYMPILQLGIQALPGTKFYLNGSNNPIIIGNTGIYELNIEGLTEINALSFDANSLDLIAKNSSAYLIIDMIYDEGGSL